MDSRRTDNRILPGLPSRGGPGQLDFSALVLGRSFQATPQHGGTRGKGPLPPCPPGQAGYKAMDGQGQEESGGAAGSSGSQEPRESRELDVGMRASRSAHFHRPSRLTLPEDGGPGYGPSSPSPSSSEGGLSSDDEEDTNEGNAPGDSADAHAEGNEARMGVEGPEASCSVATDDATDGELAPESSWSSSHAGQGDLQDMVRRSHSDLQVGKHFRSPSSSSVRNSGAHRADAFRHDRERGLSAAGGKSSLGVRKGAAGAAPAAQVVEQPSYREAGFVHRMTFEAQAKARPKPPPGRLIFDGNFEGGNIAQARRMENGSEVLITLRHDSNNEKYRLWFHFSISNALPGQQVLLTITNMSKQRSLFRNGMTPVIRSSRCPAWYRVPSSHTLYYKSPRHDGRYVLSMSLTFENPDDVYEIAYSFPFSYTALNYELSYIDFLDLSFYRRQLLTQTPQGRRVEGLTISAPMFTCPLSAPWEGAFNDLSARPHRISEGNWGSSVYSPPSARAPTTQLPCFSRTNSAMAHGPGGLEGGKRRVIFITSRVHPGETPASYVVQGLINFLTSQSSAHAALLRSALTWVIIPMLNPDGTFLGNYRCDCNGEDLNRRWAIRDGTAEPALHHVMKLLQAYNSHPNFQVDLFIDVHAHTTSRKSFMFCNRPYRDPMATSAELNAAADRITRLPKIMDTCIPVFSYSSCVYDDGPTKSGCARRVAADLVPTANCYTFEISFFHAPNERARLSQAEYDALAFSNSIEGYMAIGKQLAMSILYYYNLQPHASPPAPPQMRPTSFAAGSSAGGGGVSFSSRDSLGVQDQGMSSSRDRGSSGNFAATEANAALAAAAAAAAAAVGKSGFPGSAAIGALDFLDSPRGCSGSRASASSLSAANRSPEGRTSVRLPGNLRGATTSRGTPPRERPGAGTPPRERNSTSTTPPRERATGATPPKSRKSTPPRERGSGATPPRERNSTPPRERPAGTTPPKDRNNTPPREHASGTTPLKDGSSTPPRDHATVTTPPRERRSMTPRERVPARERNNTSPRERPRNISPPYERWNGIVVDRLASSAQMPPPSPRARPGGGSGVLKSSPSNDANALSCPAIHSIHPRQEGLPSPLRDGSSPSRREGAGPSWRDMPSPPRRDGISPPRQDRSTTPWNDHASAAYRDGPSPPRHGGPSPSRQDGPSPSSTRHMELPPSNRDPSYPPLHSTLPNGMFAGFYPTTQPQANIRSPPVPMLPIQKLPNNSSFKDRT